MAIITKPYTFNPNTKIESAKVNANFDTIYNDYNGNIDTVNFVATLAAKIAELTGGANTSLHTHSLGQGATDVTATAQEINQVNTGVSANVTAANLNSLTDGISVVALHKHNLATGGADITATPAEINQVNSGVSPDTTAANLNTLTDSNKVFAPAPFNFAQADVPANQTSIALDMLGLPGPKRYVMPYAGSIVAISIISSQDITAGDLTVKPTINGTESATLSTTLNTTIPRYNYAVQGKDVNTFVAGDKIGAKITTSATFAPTTADIVVTVFVEV